MPLTSTDVVNQAINLIGNDMPPVTGVAPTFDDSTAGKAAQQLYYLAVRAVGRQHTWDFARSWVPLVVSTNPGPFPNGFSNEYRYPVNAVQVWQLTDDFSSGDPNNPAPVNWMVGNALEGVDQIRMIWCNFANARALVNNMPAESMWDPLFQMAVVRLLANAMAMAIAGKPDVAQAMLESGSAFETLGETRAD